MSPVAYAKKLCTPKFQRMAICGYRSPGAAIASLNVSDRENGIIAPPGSWIAPFSVPAKNALFRPKIPIAPTASWPPNI